MIADQWPRCRGWLLPALRDCAEDELLADLRVGRAQLWPGERSAMVTRLVLDDGQRLLHVHLGGGALDELLAMMPGLAAWGRAMGAQFATINGRAGWARVLRAHGFRQRDGELWKALQG